jgi:hypothetical protein
MCAPTFSPHNQEIKMKFGSIGAAAIATALASPALAQAVISDPRLLCAVLSKRELPKFGNRQSIYRWRILGKRLAKRLIQPWAITGTMIIAGVTANWPSNGHRDFGVTR